MKKLDENQGQGRHKHYMKDSSRKFMFWWDSWTGKGALANFVPGLGKSAELLVNSFIKDNMWNFDKYNDTLPYYIVEDIRNIDFGILEILSSLFENQQKMVLSL